MFGNAPSPLLRLYLRLQFRRKRENLTLKFQGKNRVDHSCLNVFCFWVLLLTLNLLFLQWLYTVHVIIAKVRLNRDVVVLVQVLQLKTGSK
jgi:hypothetical protein